MNKLSDEEEMFLREEKIECLSEIKKLTNRYRRICAVKNKTQSRILDLKLRHNEADRKIAIHTKFTVVGRERKSSTVDALQAILKDRDKARRLIEILEGGD